MSFLWGQEANKVYSIESKNNSREIAIQKEQNKNGKAYFNYGLSLFKEKLWLRAGEIFSQFLTLYPQHPLHSKALFHIARVAEIQGKYEEAVNKYVQTYKEAKGEDLSLKAYLQMGRLKVRLGEIEEAQEIFMKIHSQKRSLPLAKMAKIELDNLDFE